MEAKTAPVAPVTSVERTDRVKVEDVAWFFEMKPSWVLKKLRSSELRGHRIGGQWVVWRDDLAVWLSSKGRTIEQFDSAIKARDGAMVNNQKEGRVI